MSELILNPELPPKGKDQIITPPSRRSFLASFSRQSAIGAGIVATAGLGNARAQSGPDSTITSNFNGTPIPAGDWIWFTSVFKAQGVGSAPVTIGFMGFIEFSVGGTSYFLSVPSSFVTFSQGVTVATTNFNSLGQWVTLVPSSGLSGNVFLDGFVLQVPGPNGFPGGINPVSWHGTFVSTTPGITVQWQWAAAVYYGSSFGADYNLLGVKPVDDNNASVYQNSDHAGTPEFFKQYLQGGARGGGGSNFTGSYSATGSATPVLANPGGGC
jgi:hypothetical protein